MKIKTEHYVLFAIIILLIAGIVYQQILITTQSGQANRLMEQQLLDDGIIQSSMTTTNQRGLRISIQDSGINKKLIEGELRGHNVVVASSIGYTETDIPSTHEKPRLDVPETIVDTYFVLTQTKYTTFYEKFATRDLDGNQIGVIELPLGEVGFSGWKERPWEVAIYSRKYVVDTVISQRPDDSYVVTNQFRIIYTKPKMVDGKPVLDKDGKAITEDVETVIQPSTSDTKWDFAEKSWRFSPRLYLGVDFGATVYKEISAAVNPNLTLFFFSRGRTRSDVDLAILGAGVGFEPISKEVDFKLTPIQYNIGKSLPLIDNLFVGPSISVDTKGNIAVYGGISVGL